MRQLLLRSNLILHSRCQLSSVRCHLVTGTTLRPRMPFSKTEGYHNLWPSTGMRCVAQLHWQAVQTASLDSGCFCCAAQKDMLCSIRAQGFCRCGCRGWCTFFTLSQCASLLDCEATAQGRQPRARHRKQPRASQDSQLATPLGKGSQS